MEYFRKIYEENMDENIQGILTEDLTIDDFDEDTKEVEYGESDTGEIGSMDFTLDILNAIGFDGLNVMKDILNDLSNI